MLPAPVLPAPAAGARRLVALAVLLLSFVVLLLSPTAARASSASPVLTGNEQRAVLDLIDDACGDTWCEGDFRFDFRRFTCDRSARTCTLRLRLAPYTDEAPHWYWRSGTLTGFLRFPQMVHTSATGVRSLDPDFYAAVNVLINRLEGTVPAPARPA